MPFIINMSSYRIGNHIVEIRQSYHYQDIHLLCFIWRKQVIGQQQMPNKCLLIADHELDVLFLIMVTFHNGLVLYKSSGTKKVLLVVPLKVTVTKTWNKLTSTTNGFIKLGVSERVSVWAVRKQTSKQYCFYFRAWAIWRSYYTFCGNAKIIPLNEISSSGFPWQVNIESANGKIQMFSRYTVCNMFSGIIYPMITVNL